VELEWSGIEDQNSSSFLENAFFRIFSLVLFLGTGLVFFRLRVASIQKRNRRLQEINVELNREISAIEKLGVDIRLNTRITDIDSLFDQGYKAVFLAVGAHVGERMRVPGEDVKGVYDAVEFLYVEHAAIIGIELGPHLFDGIRIKRQEGRHRVGEFLSNGGFEAGAHHGFWLSVKAKPARGMKLLRSDLHTVRGFPPTPAKVRPPIVLKAEAGTSGIGLSV
jgi:hypothetical protein